MTRSGGRLAVFAILIASLISVLLGRTVQLQASDGADYQAAAQGNGTRTIVDPAPRGLILDQVGRPLASDRQVLQVVVDRTALYSLPEDGRDVLTALAALLGTSFTALDARLTPCGGADAEPSTCWDGSSGDQVVVASDVQMAQALPVIEQPGTYPGITVQTVTRRSYPSTQGERAAQTLGHLGAVTADELPNGYGPDDLVGRGGLEQQYDRQLRGADGRRTASIDTSGRTTTTTSQSPPITGDTLVTSIDAKLQAVVEQQLSGAVDRARAAGYVADTGSAVVVDVSNGRVLAMASYPDYSPSVWDGGISQTDYQRLLDSQALMLAPIQGTYAPGSTFKPFTVAAMASHGLDLNGRYSCPGTYTAGGRTFTNLESEAYGTISLRRALEVSCNTVFYGVADRIWGDTGGQSTAHDGADPVAAAAADFGLGTATGIDLPGEATGVVSGRESTHRQWLDNKAKWCAAAAEGYPELRKTDPAKADEFTALDKENCESGGSWREGDALNAAIGQGMTAITPLQLTMAYAAIANGGTLYKPVVGKALIAADGKVTTIDPVVRSRLSASQQTLDFLKGSLVGVTTHGTAAAAFRGFGVEVAGKTGSAQVPGGKTATSWFASFAPADQPRYAVVVMVTQGGTGAGTSAPAVRGIYDALLGANPVLEGGVPSSGLPKGSQ